MGKRRRAGEIRVQPLGGAHPRRLAPGANERGESRADAGVIYQVRSPSTRRRLLSNTVHAWRYDHERSQVPYLRDPRFLRIVSEMTAMGALWVKGTSDVHTYEDGQRLDVPGRPHVVPTPGNTHGHCSLLFAERGAVIAGDAFVMLDPYTGHRGPCVVAGAATADSRENLASPDNLASVDASVAGPGHGPVWRAPMREAVERAQAEGAA